MLTSGSCSPPSPNRPSRLRRSFTGPSVVSHPVAGRTGLRAIQVADAVGTSAQARRRERQGVVAWQAPRGVAGGEVDPSRRGRFPLGIRPRPRSAWREFKFVLNQVSRAIEPLMPLARIFGEWNDISTTLAEPTRRRLPQLSGFQMNACIAQPTMRRLYTSGRGFGAVALVAGVAAGTIGQPHSRLIRSQGVNRTGRTPVQGREAPLGRPAGRRRPAPKGNRQSRPMTVPGIHIAWTVRATATATSGTAPYTTRPWAAK